MLSASVFCICEMSLRIAHPSWVVMRIKFEWRLARSEGCVDAGGWWFTFPLKLMVVDEGTGRVI